MSILRNIKKDYKSLVFKVDIKGRKQGQNASSGISNQIDHSEQTKATSCEIQTNCESKKWKTFVGVKFEQCIMNEDSN